MVEANTVEAQPQDKQGAIVDSQAENIIVKLNNVAESVQQPFNELVEDFTNFRETVNKKTAIICKERDEVLKLIERFESEQQEKIGQHYKIFKNTDWTDLMALQQFKPEKLNEGLGADIKRAQLQSECISEEKELKIKILIEQLDAVTKQLKELGLTDL